MLHESDPCPVRTENKAKGKRYGVRPSISLMREQLPGQDKDKWEGKQSLKHLDIDEDYYKSKYRQNQFLHLPNIPNQKVRQGNGRNIPITP